MKLWPRIAMIVMFAVPVVASAQYKDLDTAMKSLTQGFGSGDAQAIVAGIGESDPVQLQFPDLLDKSGFFGRDQAAYALDGLFNRAHPTGFEQQSARKVSAAGRYDITARWTVQIGGQPQTRDLYISLQNKNDRWLLSSIRSTSK